LYKFTKFWMLSLMLEVRRQLLDGWPCPAPIGRLLSRPVDARAAAVDVFDWLT